MNQWLGQHNGAVAIIVQCAIRLTYLFKVFGVLVLLAAGGDTPGAAVMGNKLLFLSFLFFCGFLLVSVKFGFGGRAGL